MINKYLNIEADDAYEKFKRSRGILGFTLGKTEELKSFREIQRKTPIIAVTETILFINTSFINSAVTSK